MDLPASYRSLIRQAVYQLVKNEELNIEFEACRKHHESLCDAKRELGEGLLSIVSSLGGTVPAKMRLHVMKYATERFEREAKLIRSNLRTRVPCGCEEQLPEKPRPSKRVRFELSTLFSTHYEERGDLGSTFADVEKVGQEVEVCNASTEGMVIKEGTQLAAASVAPESAFENLPMRTEDDVTEEVSSAPHSTSWVDAVISAVAKRSTSRVTRCLSWRKFYKKS
ncbi:hypothetical protein PI126_g22824 [Phytophthora idaei]|nr:hypothetical protein PI126_g22824 [Phytophthora idaei]